jgi:N-acetylneuraminic acid mutarotase
LKGYLYACGGNDGSSSLNSCERYCPSYDKWTPIAPMNKRRAGASVTVVNNRLYILGMNLLKIFNKRFILILGGFDDNSPLDSVECFDPDANIWTMVPNMTSCRGGVGSATLGKELIFFLIFVNIDFFFCRTFKVVVFIQLVDMMVQRI